MSNIVISPESGILEFNNNSPNGAAIGSATAPIRLDATGGNSFITGSNFGIGTTSPTQALDVSGQISNISPASARVISNMFIGQANTASEFYAVGVRRSSSALTNPDIFDKNDHGVVIGATSDEGTLVIKAGGNVGIGSASPDAKLRVAGGDIRVDSNGRYIGNRYRSFVASNTNIQLNDTTDMQFNLHNTNMDFKFGLQGSDPFFTIGGDGVVTSTGAHISGISGLFSQGLFVDGNPVMTGASDLDTDTLQTVTDRGATTTNAIVINKTAGELLTLNSTDAGANFIQFDRAGTSKVLMGFDSSSNAIFSINNTDAAGALSFSTPSSIQFSVNSAERMRIRNNGFVGIGTNIPRSNLHVYAASNAPEFRISRASNGQVWTQSIDSSARFQLKEAASEGGTQNLRFQIDDDGETLLAPNGGNVGIGTNAPSHGKLEVYGNGVNTAIAIHEDAGTHEARLHLRRGGTDFELINDGNLHIECESSKFVTLKTNGRLGIGTDDPATKLSVADGDIAAYNLNGTSRIIVSEDGSTTFNSLVMESDGASNNTHFYTDGTSNAMSISSKGATSDIVLSARQDISFKTNNGGTLAGGGERMRITSAGNVGIGTTNPAEFLHIRGDNATKLFIDGDTAGGANDSVGIRFKDRNAFDWFAGLGNVTHPDKFIIAHGTDADTNPFFTVDRNGNVGVGTINPVATLDVKADTNTTVILGRTKIGSYITDNSYISHIDNGSSVNYALKQNSAGTTALNAKAGQNLSLNINNSEILFVKGSNSFVGIGTVSVDYQLDVEGNGANTYAARIRNEGNHQNRDVLLLQGGNDSYLGNTKFIAFADGDGTETAWIQGAVSEANGGIAINASAQEANNLVIDENGKVGIGTSSPASNAFLHVTGNILSFSTDGSDRYSLAGVQATDSNFRYAGLRFDRSNNVAKFGHYLNSSLIENGFIAITESGHVGVGTQVPLAFDTTPTRFHVRHLGDAGTVSEVARFEGTSDADGAGALVRIGTTNDRGIYLEGGRIGTVPYGAIGVTEFNGAKTEAIRIKNNGNIGIGTTDPAQKLHLTDGSMRFDAEIMLRDNRDNTILKQSSSSTASNRTLQIGGVNDTTTYNRILFGQAQGGDLRVGIGTTQPSHALTVSGDVFLDGDNQQIFFGGTNTFVGESSNSQKLQLRGGGSNSSHTISIDSQGRMGFGATATERITITDGSIKLVNSNNGVNLGTLNNADGDKSVTLGYDNDALGIQSTAVGSFNQSTGTQATTFGNSNTAAVEGTAIGVNSHATASRATAVGRNNSAAQESTAIGFNAQAQGSRSIAIGRNVTASATASVAIGDTPKATGSSSIAIGVSTDVGSSKGVAVGYNNIVDAVASSSMAFGFQNQVSKLKAGAFGFEVLASGEKSFGFGHYTTIGAGNVVELGWYDTDRTRNSAVRINGGTSTRVPVAMTIHSGTNAPSASSAADGYEDGFSLASDMYSIQRNGADYVLYHNLGGSIVSTTLGGAEADTLQTVTDRGATTTNSITISDDLIVDTDTLFVDASTNRVGMGTGVPAHPLVVVAPGSTTDTNIDLTDAGGTSRLSMGYDSDGAFINGGNNGIGSSELHIRATNNSPIRVGAHNGLVSLEPGPYDGTNKYEFSSTSVKNYVRNGADGASYLNYNFTSLFADTNSIGGVEINPYYSGSERQGLTIVANSATARVGVGTVSPSSPLEVINDTSSYDGITLKSAAGNVTARIGAGDVNNNARVSLFNSSSQTAIQLHANTSNPTFFNAGKVGIGTTTPSFNFQVVPDQNGFAFVGGANLAGRALTDNARKFSRVGMPHYHNAEEPVIFIVGDSDGTDNNVTIGGGTSLGNAATKIKFHTAANDATTNGTERMIITSAGNVGIGTNSPLNPLHVFGGDLRITSDQATVGDGKPTVLFSETDNSNSHCALMYDGDNLAGDANRFSIVLNGGSAISKTTASQEKLVVNAGGNVGIGTTSPNALLDVAGPIFAGTSQRLGIGGHQDSFSTSFSIISQNNHGDFAFASNLRIDSDRNFTTVNNHSTMAGGAMVVCGNGNPFGANSIYFLSEPQGSTTAGTEVDDANARMIIKNDGNVGIGITDPDQTLHVKGIGMIEDTSSTAFGTLQFGTSATRYIRGNSAELQVGPTIQQLHFQKTNAVGQIASSAADGTDAIQILARTVHTSANILEVVNGNGASPIFNIDFTGKVGIRTTSPTELLEVAADTDVSAVIGHAHVGFIGHNSYAGFSHINRNSTTDYALIQHPDGDTLLNAAAGTKITFRINNSSAGGFNSSKDFFVDTDTLYVDSSTNRVGIKTSSPSSSLHVNGSATIAGDIEIPSSARLRWGNGDAQIKEGVHSNYSLTFSTYDGASMTDKMIILGNGNVGIGVTDPSASLEVHGGNGSILIGSGIYPSYNAITLNGSTSQNDYNFISSSSDKNLYINRSSSKSIFFRENNSNQMVIEAGGNVGIGTNNPQSKLEVHGQLKIESSVDDMLHLNATDSGPIYIAFDRAGDRHALVGFAGTSDSFQITNEESGGDISYSALNFQRFNTAGLERMRINSDGNVGIGTNVPALQSAGTGLHIHGSVNSELKFTNGTAGATASDGTALVSNGSSFTINNREAGPITFGTNNTVRMAIDSAGKVGIGTNSPNAPLEIRGAVLNDAPLLRLQGTNNAHGATIQFNDNSSSLQNGNITYRHADSQSQGGGASFHFTGEADTTLVVGNSTNKGRMVVSSAGSVSEADYGFYDDVNMGMSRMSADELGFITAGTERVRVDNAGNVGIGTNNPQHELQVKGDVSIDNESSSEPSMLHFNATNKANLDPTSRINFWEGNSHNNTYTDSNAFIEYNGSTAAGGDGYLAIGGFTNAGANQDIMVLNRLGRVGIGTLTPYTTLQVGNSNDSVGISTNVKLYVADGGIRVGSNAGSDFGYRFFRDSSNGDLVFIGDQNGNINYNFQNYAGTSLLKIKNNGDVGIGTTNPSDKLSVNLAANGDSVGFMHGSSRALEFERTSNDNVRITNTRAFTSLLQLGTAGGVGINIKGQGDGNGSFVGIGTDTPLANLHVKSNNAGSFTYDTTADELIVESNADGGITIATAAANTSKINFASPNDANGAAITYNQVAKLMKVGATSADGKLALLSANGVETMRLDENNRVGIGSNNPQNKFHVYAADGDSVDNYIGFFENDEATAGDNFGLKIKAGSSSSDTSLDVLGSDGSNYLRVRGDGNVGIGTNSPEGILHMQDAGDMSVILNSTTNDADVQFKIGTGPTSAPIDNGVSLHYEGATTNNFKINNNGKPNSSITLHTRQAGGSIVEAIRIDANQNVGIGSNNPQTKLDVNGTIKSAVYAIGSLPSASPAGQRAFVNNSTVGVGSTTVGAGVTSYAGGYNAIPVYSDGSIWRIG